MGKLVLFMHVSLDGFTARPNGEMDWIRIGDEMFEQAGIRTEHSAFALYGRNTYQIMNAYWPTAADKRNASRHDIQHSNWYNQVNKIVISKTMEGQLLDKTTIISRDIPEAIGTLKRQTTGEIIMFGSPSLSGSLMQEDLIDEYWFFLNPIILGEGISLYSKNKRELPLHLIETIRFPSGVNCLHYSKI
jgi:dihydrofolate reductase